MDSDEEEIKVSEDLDENENTDSSTEKEVVPKKTRKASKKAPSKRKVKGSSKKRQAEEISEVESDVEVLEDEPNAPEKPKRPVLNVTWVWNDMYNKDVDKKSDQYIDCKKFLAAHATDDDPKAGKKHEKYVAAKAAFDEENARWVAKVEEWETLYPNKAANVAALKLKRRNTTMSKKRKAAKQEDSDGSDDEGSKAGDLSLSTANMELLKKRSAGDGNFFHQMFKLRCQLGSALDTVFDSTFSNIKP